MRPRLAAPSWVRVGGHGVDGGDECVGDSSCWCAACGGLVVLVRCRRGSCLACALPQGVVPCWCAAAGGLGLVVRCLGWRWVWSPKGPRPGGWAGPCSGFSGCGAAWTHDSSFVRRRFETSAFPAGSRHERRSVQAPTHEGSIVSGLWGGVGSASPFSWHGPREGSIVATSDPVGGGFSTCTALRRWQIHRRRRCGGKPTARPSRPTRSPGPQAGARPADRSRPFRSAGRLEAAPTQPHPNEKPRRRSPTRARSRTDAAPPEREAAPTQPHPNEKPRRRTRRSARTRTQPTGQADPRTPP
jgi:hypothetical protein